MFCGSPSFSLSGQINRKTLTPFIPFTPLKLREGIEGGYSFIGPTGSEPSGIGIKDGYGRIIAT